MKKRFAVCALALLAFCGCEEKDVTVEETDAVISETVMTVFEPIEIEFAEVKPFEASSDEEDHGDIREAVERISDAMAFLNANATGFYYESRYQMSYADQENPLEVNEEEEYSYSPLNPEIAEDKEGLIRYFRGVYTEDFLSDERLDEMLFEPFNDFIPAEYKVIDGVLCIKWQYLGVMDSIVFDRSVILSYDGKKAEVMTDTEGVSDDGEVFFLSLVNSEEYGWRLDSLSHVYFDKDAVNSAYTLSLQVGRLNDILDGRADEGIAAEIEGEKYFLSGAGMTVSQMKDYFEKLFTEEICADYTERYIDGVYAEKDGKLYRRADIPRYYVEDMYVDMHTSDTFDSNGRWIRIGKKTVTAPYDREGKDIISIEYAIGDGNEFIYAKFASKLPVKER